jgi:hypothetical protein
MSVQQATRRWSALPMAQSNASVYVYVSVASLIRPRHVQIAVRQSLLAGMFVHGAKLPEYVASQCSWPVYAQHDTYDTRGATRRPVAVQ